MSDWMDLPGASTGDEGGEKSLSDPVGAGLVDPDGALESHLWVFQDGAVWDLGPAQLDADSDGVPDSLTRGADGLLTVYTDTDADGRVDRITELDPTGRCAVHHLDAGTGRWQPTTLGRLD
ncbi:MAG: hypothetical protein QM809_05555 [Gordonia sp. (in: high G+C Gram-positive bacteria)]|uniref:DUF6802 family protein n=1 Tax=Gordonia sp. (in: high G+C Gram-positive bacteria) TaxID=84139 RepID=UPI0039E3BCEB